MVETMTTNAPALKDKLNAAAITAVADVVAASSNNFNRQAFLENALKNLADRSLIERLRHIATALGNALDGPYGSKITRVS